MNRTALIKTSHGQVFSQSMPARRHRYREVLRHGWRPIDRTLKAFAEGVVAARQVARLYDELTALSDPELADIGINRADIPAVISGTYRRLPPSIPVRISNGRRERSLSPNRSDHSRDQGASL